MFDTILGLPAHPLYVHAAVVLLPLMALVTAVVAWRPAWWPRLGLPVAVLDFLVLGATFVAKESGERLEHRLPSSDAIREHAELGDQLPLLAGLLFLCALIPALLAFRARRAGALPVATATPDGATDGRRVGVAGATAPASGAGSRGVSRGIALATAVLTTLVALAAAYLTVQVGHTGASAVWSGYVS